MIEELKDDSGDPSETFPKRCLEEIQYDVEHDYQASVETGARRVYAGNGSGLIGQRGRMGVERMCSKKKE